MAGLLGDDLGLGSMVAETQLRPAGISGAARRLIDARGIPDP
jgi:hypothetical protein